MFPQPPTTPFDPTSRYYSIATQTSVNAAGESIVYVARRFVPPQASFSQIGTHIVVQGERYDSIAYTYLGDPTQFWQICDANGVMDPNDLEIAGATVSITLPAGIPGIPVIDRAYLTLLMGGMIPLPVPQAVADALTSVQVTIASDQRSGFQLVFAMSRESQLSRILLPTGYFDPQTRVILILTVNGIPNVLMDGIIMRQEMAPSNDLGKATLTVTGEDVSVMMSLQEVKMLYPVLSENLIVMAILAKYLMYGIIPLALPPLFPNITDPLEQIPAQSETDLDYINKLAKRVGYVFFIQPGPLPGTNTAYFGPEVRIGIPQSALNVNMDQYSNVESINFSIDGSSREQLAVAIQEPNTGLTIPIPIPDISPLAPPMALRQAPSLKYKFINDSSKLTPLQALSKAIGLLTKASDAVTASGQLDVLRYGRVLQARQLVGVRGAGLAYDGLYYVKSVTHNINVRTGEFKQSFQMARNGTVPLTPAVVA